jgi:DNA polymerase/3'-5' exonuclease PolX
MSDVRDIYGIGSKKANQLRKHYNIRTIYSLRKYVRKIPDIITDVQRTGLKYHDKINKYISYAEAGKHVDFILNNINGAVIAGSYRRKSKKIGDIDILITDDLKKTVNKLENKNYIVEILSIGDEKFSGIAKLPNTTSYRRIDIIKTTTEEKPFALLYFTGDFVQNIYMRQKAKKMNYSMSQYGITNIKTGKMVKNIKSEKDIFNFLKIPYKNPEDRTHEGKEKDILSELK